MTTQRNTAVRRLNRAIDLFRETDWQGSHFGQLGQLAESLAKLSGEIETHVDAVLCSATGDFYDQVVAELEGDGQ